MPEMRLQRFGASLGKFVDELLNPAGWHGSMSPAEGELWCEVTDLSNGING